MVISLSFAVSDFQSKIGLKSLAILNIQYLISTKISEIDLILPFIY